MTNNAVQPLNQPIQNRPAKWKTLNQSTNYEHSLIYTLLTKENTPGIAGYQQKWKDLYQFRIQMLYKCCFLQSCILLWCQCSFIVNITSVLAVSKQVTLQIKWTQKNTAVLEMNKTE